jgi:hypothetical protein
MFKRNLFFSRHQKIGVTMYCDELTCWTRGCTDNSHHDVTVAGCIARKLPVSVSDAERVVRNIRCDTDNFAQTVIDCVRNHKIYSSGLVLGESCGFVSKPDREQRRVLILRIATLSECAAPIFKRLERSSHRMHLLQATFRPLLHLAESVARSLLEAWCTLLVAPEWPVVRALCSVIWRESESLSAILEPLKLIEDGAVRGCVLQNYYRIPHEQRKQEHVAQMASLLRGQPSRFLRLLDLVPPERLIELVQDALVMNVDYWGLRVYLLCPRGENTMQLSHALLRDQSHQARNLMVQALRNLCEEKRVEALNVRHSDPRERLRNFRLLCAKK